MADGADWKYYMEKCKVLLIFSQEKCVFPYDYIIDDSALAPNSHDSCFPARLLAGFYKEPLTALSPGCRDQGLSPQVPRDAPTPPLALEDFLHSTAGDTPPFHGSAVQALIPNWFWQQTPRGMLRFMKEQDLPLASVH